MQQIGQLSTAVAQTTGIRLIHNLRAKPDDAACKQEIVNHYGPWVWHWALAMAPGVETAKVIVQEFYVKLFKHANGNLQLNNSLRPWIKVVVRNLAIELRRQQARRPDNVSLSDAMLEWIESPGSQALLVEQLDQADQWAEIAARIGLAGDWSDHRDELLRYRSQYLQAEKELLTDSRFGLSTYIAFLLIAREHFEPIDVKRELKFSPGYASKCRAKVEKALLKRMGLESSTWSRAILEWVVGYG